MIILDIPTVLFLGFVEAIVDIIIFKVLKVRHVTVFINIVVNFVVPIITIWLIAQSNMPFAEQILVVADIFVTYTINLFNFILASVVGLIVSYTFCMFTGERPGTY